MTSLVLDRSARRVRPHSEDVTFSPDSAGWTGEVTADHQGYRVLGAGAQGTMQPTSRLAVNFPAILLLRVYGMNGNGKVYLLTKAVQLNR
jgi:hypothetical protein